MQAFAIKRNIVEVVQARIGYRRDTMVVQELKNSTWQDSAIQKSRRENVSTDIVLSTLDS